METRIATAIATGSAAEAAESLGREVATQLGGAAPALLLVFGSTAQPLSELMPPLAARFPGARVLGASTAGEFTERGDKKGAAALFAVHGDFKIFAGMGAGLKEDPEGAISAATRELPAEVEGFPHRTALLLLDPLAGNGEEATLIAAGILGEDVRLAGGAAGDDLKMLSTQVGCGGHVASDAAVVGVIFSKRPLGVGVCHGHQPLSGPLRVTRASGNVVSEIEGEPAWRVWERETRESAKQRGVDPSSLAPEELGGYLLRYEAGLATGSEYKIRAPLSRGADGSLSFACGIPEGAEIQITESEPERQVESAREAARRARVQLGGAAPAGALVFDCICRNLILGDDFRPAVRAISEELSGTKLAGFETYGEIALDAGDMSGFHNTTTVVLAFPR